MQKTLSILLLLITLFACGHKQTQDGDIPVPEVLMQVGDSVLTRNMVLAQLPAGISAEDSARLFDAIVEEWLERNMLADIASKNIPDMERIDAMVEQYRRQLMTEEYRRLMAEEYKPEVSEDSIRRRYEQHPEAYTLTQPIIKGIYVKLPARAPQLAEVRGWVKKASPEAIDELEKYGLKGAMEYDWFGDQWVAWSEIARRIPYRFDSQEGMAVSGKQFETTVDGSTYLLHITEAMPSGSRMPYDMAKPRIEQELLERHRDEYDRRLLHGIYSRAIDNRRIHVGTYVPLRYRNL